MKNEKMFHFLKGKNMSLFNEIREDNNKSICHIQGVVRGCEEYIRRFMGYNIPLDGVVIAKDGLCFELLNISEEKETIFISGVFRDNRACRCTYDLGNFMPYELIFLVNTLNLHFNKKYNEKDFAINITKDNYIDYIWDAFEDGEDVMDVEDAEVYFNDILITHIVRLSNGTINFYNGDPATEDYSTKIVIDKNSEEFLEVCEKLIQYI